MQRARLSTSGFHGNVTTPKWWRHQLESRNVINMKSRKYPAGYMSVAEIGICNWRVHTSASVRYISGFHYARLTNCTTNATCLLGMCHSYVGHTRAIFVARFCRPTKNRSFRTREKLRDLVALFSRTIKFHDGTLITF